MRYTIGIDLGGSKIAAGLVDEGNNIVQRAFRPTRLPRPMSEIMPEMAAMCGELCKAEGVRLETDVDYVGIGTPGSVNPKTGMVEFNANFNYRDLPLAAEMRALLPCDVHIENDANAAAFGEYMAGGAMGAQCAVVITLGTGIGSGIIIDGKIFSGFNSAGAEMGHTVIVMNGRPCMCGRKGCWEKYASARALSEDTRAAMQKHPGNMMWNLAGGELTRVNAKTAFDAMRKGDWLGTAVVDQFVEYVACGLINVINIFQPEIICIGGGVSKEGQRLLAPLQNYIDQEDFARQSKRRTKIVTAKLFNDAGIIGAARLGAQNIL